MKAQALRGFYRQDGSSLQLSRELCSTKFVLFKRLDFYYCLHLDLSFLHHPGPNHSMWVLFLWTSWMCTMDDAMMYFTPIFVICSHIQIMMMIVNAVRGKPRPESHLVKLGKHDSLLQMMLQWGKLRHMLSDPGWVRFTFENPGWDGGGWTCWRLKYRLRQERNDQWTWCCDSRSTVYGHHQGSFSTRCWNHGWNLLQLTKNHNQ